jgi:hypothetical protein
MLERQGRPVIQGSQTDVRDERDAGSRELIRDRPEHG